jgi:hypothetical protein
VRFGAIRIGISACVASRFLAIYLNDHLAGATVGVELARRSAKENEGSDLGMFLRDLLVELEEDRATLQRLMEVLAVRRSKPKTAAAWAAEKLGRLKLNGQIRGYSPLSRLLELEGLASGIEGKRALWLALAQLDDGDRRRRDVDVEALAQRAHSQRERLEPYRLAASARALG